MKIETSFFSYFKQHIRCSFYPVSCRSCFTGCTWFYNHWHCLLFQSTCTLYIIIIIHSSSFITPCSRESYIILPFFISFQCVRVPVNSVNSARTVHKVFFYLHSLLNSSHTRKIIMVGCNLVLCGIFQSKCRGVVVSCTICTGNGFVIFSPLICKLRTSDVLHVVCPIWFAPERASLSIVSVAHDWERSVSVAFCGCGLLGVTKSVIAGSPIGWVVSVGCSCCT